ncbi:MAG: ABC transporter permease [Comamonas sp. SCN 65-56]|uniref:branched-chain amino acid ABC transporter permease n=1 Tax=Comamonas sp. SCN 65-56 TaxID=1660095 RepID=UPI000868B0A6|nr:branched-chain amino acid ABC transporter permease [Comamonas sp. SCN 65-56]ODS93153.1 MAG: ABC transporter permease [Comamonas sp. SCN 65-56]
MFAGILDQTVSGLANGAIYASVALALVMIYTTTDHINFAQGEMALFSTYLGWWLISAGLDYWTAFAATIVASMAMGGLIERILIRRTEGQSMLVLIVVFIGLMILLNSLAGVLFGYETKSIESPFNESVWGAVPHVGPHQLGMLTVILAMLGLVYLFFRFTSLGLKMRAAAQNPISSRLVGINVGAMLCLGWALAAGIGAAAGMMTAPLVYLEPNMMSGIIIYAFAGALLGGIDNPWGAAVGGFLLGIIETLAGSYLVGTDLRLTVALLVIIVVLLARPRGLFGKQMVVRV